MIVKLLTEFLSLKGGCRGSSEATHVKMSHCWKSHVAAHFISISIQCIQTFKISGFKLLREFTVSVHWNADTL